ncbi:flagellar basal body rod C-terminal domain-containing protein [Helicobacter canadensis]|uniref:Flagellar protein flgE n=1 Tax=Helicobacter canadensis MIT 98-5491 TaxID=537970 RepID=C5ZV66_9HELI|nr:flagellar basal body rod C-terminal domain-containing protein [Helicobacter canadensis]EES89130.1 flagellar protein flgE [Helicobacter canadensis MIT 98-5491]EFR47910.1 hypothetical protein HCMG_00083 [Helicobacter canadensis MIT 98-5491]STO99163.1 flagellar hook protein FlgE [Helicobacter canadensis]
MDPISMNSYSGYNAFSNAQSGINANVQNATLETSNTDLTQSTANTITAQNGVEANVASMQTADSMYQSLLDITA